MGVWKLSDFGISKDGTSGGFKATPNQSGSNGYRPPEILDENFPEFNNKVDIWGLGCVMSELLTGQKVFDDDWAVIHYSRDPTLLNIIVPQTGQPDLDKILLGVEELLLSMFEIRAVKRMSAKFALEHLCKIVLSISMMRKR